MKAPLKWLLAYTDIKYEDSDAFSENVASLMTLSGSKVETVDRLYGGLQLKNLPPDPHITGIRLVLARLV